MQPVHLKHSPRFLMRVCLVLLTIGLSVIVAQSAPRKEQQGGDSCIRCHVGFFNDEFKQTYLHAPFFERRCTTCHLRDGADLGGSEASGAESFITGTQVNQDIVWGKISRFTTDEGRSFDHLTALEGLKSESSYRFRIAQGNQPAQANFTSPWYGLRPAELSSSDRIGVTVKPIENSATSLTITPAGSGAPVISWQTSQPLHGWVEVQQLDADLPSPEASGSKSGHPSLREPEKLAIEACYECHPESTLGTSHPVRLYGGRDVKIPDDLPTVDGMLTCVTCHEPHGAEGKMLIRETVKTKLCVACHYNFKNTSPSTMFD